VLAAVATRADPDGPLAAIQLQDLPDPAAPEGWEVVEVRAAALNHHDLWTLMGVGVRPEHLPVVLGTSDSGEDETMADDRLPHRLPDALHARPAAPGRPRAGAEAGGGVGSAAILLAAAAGLAQRPQAVVVSGSTTGGDPPAELERVFFPQLSVVGSTMGTLDELRRLCAFRERAAVRPVIDSERPLSQRRRRSPASARARR
jgi:NADPH:quinone reductase-like Zn-dependent oxidoreductase